MKLYQKGYSHIENDIQLKTKHKDRRSAAYLNNLSDSVLNIALKDNIAIEMSKAYQRLISYQADDGSFSYTKWENR